MITLPESPFEQHVLPNGLVLEFFDCSNRYFGDYYRVVVAVRCTVAIHQDLFAEEDNPGHSFEAARKTLGSDVLFSKDIVSMGVSGERVPSCRENMVEQFIETTGAYMGKPHFPVQFVSQKAAAKKKVVVFRPPLS